MSQFTRREQTTRVVELALPTPTDQGQFQRALHAAHADLADRAADDDAVQIDVVDGELVLRYTVINGGPAAATNGAAPAPPVTAATPAPPAAPATDGVDDLDGDLDGFDTIDLNDVGDPDPAWAEPADAEPEAPTPPPAAASAADGLEELLGGFAGEPEAISRDDADDVPDAFRVKSDDDETSAIGSSFSTPDEEDDEFVFTVKTGPDADDEDDDAPSGKKIAVSDPDWTQHYGSGRD